MPDFLVSRFLSPFWVLILLAGLHGGGIPHASAAESIDPPKNTPHIYSTNPQPDKTKKNPAITDTTIKTEMAKQRVRDLKVQAKAAGTNIYIHPQTIDITVLGPPFDLEQDNGLKKNISAYINVTESTPGLYARPARIILPEGYVIIDATPEVFIVEIKPVENSTP